jgi:hypothetical protein
MAVRRSRSIVQQPEYFPGAAGSRHDSPDQRAAAQQREFNRRGLKGRFCPPCSCTSKPQAVSSIVSHRGCGGSPCTGWLFRGRSRATGGGPLSYPSPRLRETPPRSSGTGFAAANHPACGSLRSITDLGSSPRWRFRLKLSDALKRCLGLSNRPCLAGREIRTTPSPLQRALDEMRLGRTHPPRSTTGSVMA